MNKQIVICPHCQSDAILKEDTMTIQSGLNKIVTPANSYVCTGCGRVFSTHEQRKETTTEVSQKRHKLPHPDLGTGRQFKRRKP